ncbi:MAG: hypothetical protein RLP02_19365 [Coleofasciculus sp. C2-GNP5-27]
MCKLPSFNRTQYRVISNQGFTADLTSRFRESLEIGWAGSKRKESPIDNNLDLSAAKPNSVSLSGDSSDAVIFQFSVSPERDSFPDKSPV